ncbi:MAG: tRNA epoxyqueuosine(34) reductase QueG [Fimbriimonadaceae bacterium]
MALPSAELKAYARSQGFQALGIAPVDAAHTIGAYEAWLAAGLHGEMTYLARHVELKRSPSALLPGARSVVAVALNYNRANPERAGEPRIARYALGRDYHKVLRSMLRSMARHLAKLHPGAIYRVCVDSAPLLEREYAHRAGLGWFGKNTCLIDSRNGSWFVLGFLLTTLEFEPDAPAVGGCGTCRQCIDACPTGAIVRAGERWVVDSRRCISYLTIEKRGDFTAAESSMVGGWTFGCDVCQEVCPFNVARESQPLRGRSSTVPDFLQGPSWPSLVELAQIGEGKWDDLTRGSSVRRARLDGLKRNAAANLSNSA